MSDHNQRTRLNYNNNDDGDDNNDGDNDNDDNYDNDDSNNKSSSSSKASEERKMESTKKDSYKAVLRHTLNQSAIERLHAEMR